MAVGVVQVPEFVAGLEGEQEVAARGEDAVELVEDGRQQLRRCVDDRVPRDDAGEPSVGQLQARHRPFLETDFRVRRAGHRHHPGRQVDPEDVQPEGVQVTGDPAGTAPEVGDPAGAVRPHQVGEGAEHGPVHRHPGERRPQQPFVVDGDGVVGGAGAAQEVRFGRGVQIGRAHV